MAQQSSKSRKGDPDVEDILDYFPFDGFREGQKDALLKAFKALYIDDYDNVILDLPTGIGKSPINTALCDYAESSFMTTPQKKLRNQLGKDDVLNQYYKVLKGRQDYRCGASGENCSDCPINQKSSESCRDYVGKGCTYWQEKIRAMKSETAVLTFAYLIVDKYIPQYAPVGDGQMEPEQISFGNRELLVVDEAHTLEGQTASLFAGFKVSPWSVPAEIYGNTGRELHKKMSRHQEVEDLLHTIASKCNNYIEEYSAYEDDELPDEIVDNVSKCENYLQNYGWFKDEIDEGRDWVVDIEEVSHPERRGDVKSMKMSPVKVDNFLQNFIWGRANKRVISTATMPFRDKPERWERLLGLPGKTKVIRKPMYFPKENRKIHTGEMIGKMSSGGFNENWKQITKKLRELADRHSGEKGLVHTGSYDRAERLYKVFKSNAMVHRGEKDANELIDEWQKSDCDMLFSPSMMEGVDLKGDKCRWQAIVKVPYPSPGNSRVDYKLNEQNAWGWYYEETAMKVIQSVGRGVRSEDDWCEYYVLDESFEDVLSRVDIPDWFTDAIVP